VTREGGQAKRGWRLFFPHFFRANVEVQRAQSSEMVAFSNSRLKTPGVTSLPGPSGLPQSPCRIGASTSYLEPR